VLIRHATTDDIQAIERVMRNSIIGISSRTYDGRQVDSSLRFVAHLDRELVNDRTYFVVEIDDQIVACGGWSHRKRLYAGSGASNADAEMLDPATDAARIRAMFVLPDFERRGIGRMILEACEEEARSAGFRELELMAMLSGHAMYLACGYQDIEKVPATLEDGTPYPLIRMRKKMS